MLPRESKPSSWFTISSIVRCTSLSPPCPSSNRAPPIASTCAWYGHHPDVSEGDRSCWVSSKNGYSEHASSCFLSLT